MWISDRPCKIGASLDWRALHLLVLVPKAAQEETNDGEAEPIGGYGDLFGSQRP